MVGEVNKIKAKYNKYIHLDWDRVVEVSRARHAKIKKEWSRLTIFICLCLIQDEAKRVHTVGDLRQAVRRKEGGEKKRGH